MSVPLALRLKQREIGVPCSVTAPGAACSARAITSGPCEQAAGSFSLFGLPPQPVTRAAAITAADSRRTPGSIRISAYDRGMPPLSVAEPLAHRALEALLRAEAHVRRGVPAELAGPGL